MKLKLKQYTEPLTIEVERPDGTTDAVELTLSLSDTNVLRSEKAARKIAEAANGMTGEDYERQARELGRLGAPRTRGDDSEIIASCEKNRDDE